jgi:2-methylcitrate dehydratase
MTLVKQLAEFVVRANYDAISQEARQQLKIRVLDGLGCAIGALEGEPIQKLRAHLDEFGGNPLTTLIGGGKTAPDRAAFYNSALVRYLDYNDSYPTRGETCHPSDNLGAVLAASEYAGRSGKDLLTALAVAYQVQGRLSEVAPVRAKGFDHTVQGAYAAAAGVASALLQYPQSGSRNDATADSLQPASQAEEVYPRKPNRSVDFAPGLNVEQTANAIAISGTANNALRVTRTGKLSNWKGLAYPNTVFGATHAAFLAMRGITGPQEVFEGNKGFMEAIAGHFELDWQRENLEAVLRSSVKKYNAEFHSQSALEGMLELRAAHRLQPQEIECIELDTFDVAYHIIGGGEEGDKQHISTKEEADHSLPYMLAVALLDGEVSPAQYRPERILRDDVQSLLRKVVVRPDDALSARFPAEMPCRLRIFLKNGQQYSVEKRDYEGFATRPMSWESAQAKFERLATPYADPKLLHTLEEMVAHLEEVEVPQLTAVLAKVGGKNK